MQFMLGVLAVLLPAALGVSNPVVDLSHWNGAVDLGKAKNDGIAGVIHKATQGIAYVDPTYTTRQGLAQRAGVLWGAYHFGVGGKSGAEQAKHFLRTVGSTRGVLLVLDIEENKAGKSMSKAEADEFVRTVKDQTGNYPLIYGSPYYLESYDTPALKACKLWVAHYTGAASPRLPKGRNNWVLWQYTDGRVGGSPRTVKGIGNCDRNKYVGTVEELRSKWPNL